MEGAAAPRRGGSRGEGGVPLPEPGGECPDGDGPGPVRGSIFPERGALRRTSGNPCPRGGAGGADPPGGKLYLLQTIIELSKSNTWCIL